MGFLPRLIETLAMAQFRRQRGNHDHYRYGPLPAPSLSERLADFADRVLSRAALFRRSRINRISEDALNQWGTLFTELAWFYDRLSDDSSRFLLVQLVAYRLMGHRAIRLPLSTPDYWKGLRQLAKLADARDVEDAGLNDWKLPLHDLNPIGYPIRLYARSPGIMTQFVVEQYANRTLKVEAEPGNCILDCGGCFGDTALYFAHRSGPTGRVWTFEFVPENLCIMRRNLGMNPELARSISIVQHPLWKEPGVQFPFRTQGPGSRLLTEPSSDPVHPTISTESIDHFVSINGVERLDLIKMDIEGAEREALWGAQSSIRRFKPKLAICIYHKPSDFVVIPRTILEIEPAYRFSIGHATIHTEETVLFARL